MLWVVQGLQGRGEARVCVVLVLESIEGVMLSSSATRWDFESQSELITWRSLEGSVS